MADPMCPASLARIEHRPDICRCEEYAHVRADERASAYPGREIRSQLLEARTEVAALSGVLNVAIGLLSDVGITCTVESLIEEAERE